MVTLTVTIGVDGCGKTSDVDDSAVGTGSGVHHGQSFALLVLTVVHQPPGVSMIVIRRSAVFETVVS